ncbi:DUF389 domain-containing protein [Marinobacter daqiaonensis]|uniref:DUF389 domain-containing protein n=1 Tax=Marinobacter daqiaonensis TaxID=650891 RepID=UPI001113B260|nr:DUF389 domain-containing protein [Marinobacter daqiaonensis]
MHDHLVRGVISEARSDYAYYIFMTLSGVLAAIALLTDSVPLLLGAMIVAPAYPLLAAVSFSIAGGYPRTAGRALLVLFGGLALAIAAAVVTTWLCNVADILPSASNLVSKPLLEERVRTGWYSIIAAVAAGAGGTVAVIKRKQDALIGVVAAIALIPAGAAGALAAYSGDFGRAIGGFVLLAVNILVIIALGLLVLVAIRPGRTDAAESKANGSEGEWKTWKEG